jgi:hypothetical protein
MPSKALVQWRGPAAAILDEVVYAHTAVGGRGPGRRRLTQQINHAYVALLTAQFQGFCRALHSEAANAISVVVPDPALAVVVESLLTQGRHLDRGNPTPGNLGADFGRLGFGFWAAVDMRHAGSPGRRKKLEALCTWRNAIAHADITAKRAAGLLDPGHIVLDTCTSWRQALGGLAGTFDTVVADQCENLGAPRPW